MTRGPRPRSYTRRSNAKLWQNIFPLCSTIHVRLTALQFPEEFPQPTRTFQLATQEIVWAYFWLWLQGLSFEYLPRGVLMKIAAMKLKAIRVDREAKAKSS